MIRRDPEGAFSLAQVKMRDKTVWRAKVSFVIDRSTSDGGTEQFRKTLTGTGSTPEAAKQRLDANIVAFKQGSR